MRLSRLFYTSVLVAAACSPDIASFATKYTTPEERGFAVNYLRLLANGQFDSGFALLAPQMKSDTARKALEQVGALLRNAQLDSLRIIGVNINNLRNSTGGSRQVNLSYEMPADSTRWVIANVATQSSQSRVEVIGFSASPTAGPLEKLNAFALRGRSFLHYVVLVLAIIMPIITLSMAVTVARAKGMPRRWLWVMLALVASPVFSIDWTTGAFTIRNTFFLLLGGAALRTGPAAPWVISFAIPIGAAVAYFQLRRWRDRPAPAASAAA
jgi:hypothetical protein